MKFICLSTRYMTGGASLNAVLVAKGLAERGHECEAWFLMRAGEMDDSGLNIRIFAEKTPSSVKEWIALLRAFFSAAREFKADAIISFYPLANILGCFAKLAGGAKRFIASQRNPVQEQNKVIYWLEMLCGSTPLYDANIAVSAAVEKSCGGHPAPYRRKIRVVYNGVPPLVSVGADKDACRDVLGVPRNVFLVGSIGRLDPQKNVAMLLDMMRHLPGMHLLVAGTGTLEAELKGYCAEHGLSGRVTFAGNLQKEKVAMFYRAIDVFAFATFYEGFGRTLVEAFSVGTPVVASDIEVLREVGGDAAVFAPNETQAWVAALRNLAESPAALESLKIRGRERAAVFTLPAMVDGYLEIAKG